MGSDVTNRTCYDRQGTIATFLYACYPDRAISNCCPGIDYCTDIGLCLDSAGNNNLGQHGCTQAEFDPVACPNPCPEPATDLEYCGVPSLFAPGQYCCDRGIAKCCATSEGQFTLPLFSSVFKAPAAAPPAPTVTVTSGAASSATDGAFASAAAAADASRRRTVLALSIPLGCLALVLLAVLVCMWRRRRNAPSSQGPRSPRSRMKPTLPPQELPATPAADFDDGSSGCGGGGGGGGGVAVYYHQPPKVLQSSSAASFQGSAAGPLQSFYVDMGPSLDGGSLHESRIKHPLHHHRHQPSYATSATPLSSSIGMGTIFTDTPNSREPLRWNMTPAEVEGTWNVGELPAETPIVYKGGGDIRRWAGGVDERR